MRTRRTSFVTAALRLAVLMLAAFALSGCMEDGPILFEPSQDYSDRVSKTCSVVPGSDIAPVVASDRVEFELPPGGDCSALRFGDDWALGHNYLMGFDVRLDRNRIGSRPVTLARLVRSGASETELVSVKASRQNGITVLGRRCVPASEFGTWHRVELRVALSDQDEGFLEVFCDRKPIWAQDKIRTTLPPVCRRSEGCTIPVAKPVRFEWQIGLMTRHAVAHRLKIEMRRVFYRRLFLIPHRIGNL
ncbi:hypothetical protein RXV86_15100 [Alisedimentitalea sp. MJ-SS2]|uniref:hypothetical protein n=1 Tax=Aliisedimentitalea sp. MJ-SS2 TaxID=3049795 RepID=UPI00290A03DE|nr:hypothetical protein [Alisedimentitalea sp. MJ-SS2]MDU8928717.1 hypothetical protein [Alisedimentitalea sp. MJ-SS2]